MSTASEQQTQQEIQSLVDDFFEKGGTFKDIKGLSDETMEAVYGVAFNLYSHGKYEDAEKIFRFLGFFDHLNKKYFMGLGACRQMLKKYQEAIESYTFASMLDADDPLPPLHAGECHLATGNLEAAESGFYAAVNWATKPEHAKVKDRASGLLELVRSARKGEEASQ